MSGLRNLADWAEVSRTARLAALPRTQVAVENTVAPAMENRGTLA